MASNGVELELAAPETAVLGSRVPVMVTARNMTGQPVVWEAGGCAIRMTVWLAEPGATPFPALESPRFTGDPTALPAWLAAPPAPTTVHAQPAAFTGRRELICTADSFGETLAPGDVVRFDGSFELQRALGDAWLDRPLVITAEFHPHREGFDWFDSPLPPATISVPLTVVDDVRRAPSADAAVGALTGSDALASWLESTAVAGRPDLTQGYVTELTWWRDN